MASLFSFFSSTLQIPASLPANSSHTVVSILWRAERGVKKKKKKCGGRRGGGVGEIVAAASQCLSVGEAERQQRRRRRRPQPPPRGFPAAPPVRQDFHTASLVIEGAHSRRCTPLSSLPLRAARFSAFCSLSWLETGEYGSEVAEAAGCSSACCPQLSAVQGGEKKKGGGVHTLAQTARYYSPPTPPQSPLVYTFPQSPTLQLDSSSCCFSYQLSRSLPPPRHVPPVWLQERDFERRRRGRSLKGPRFPPRR